MNIIKTSIRYDNAYNKIISKNLYESLYHGIDVPI